MRETRPAQGDKGRTFESHIILGDFCQAIVWGYSSANQTKNLLSEWTCICNKEMKNKSQKSKNNK